MVWMGTATMDVGVDQKKTLDRSQRRCVQGAEGEEEAPAALCYKMGNIFVIFFF